MLYRKYEDKGLRVLAFPANNFMNQEPLSNSEIKTFCQSKFDVTFDVFAKISVKGDDQAPLYRFLTTHPDDEIKGDVAWNFQKYLVDRHGNVVAKFGPRTSPQADEIVAAVEKALAEKSND